MTQKNIFIVGLDDFNYENLKPLEEIHPYRFHSLLSFDKIREEQTDVDGLIEQANAKLDAFDGSIDAIVGFWDFPVSLMVPYLSERRGLTAASLRDAIKCEHKYWSRLYQREAAPDNVPAFCAVDPFADDASEQITLDYPYWLKPIKAMSSDLGYRIENEDDLKQALANIRDNINNFGDPFNFFLDQIELPAEVEAVTGNHCIAEQLIGGEQCTLSGYVYRGEVNIFGVVDSLNYPETTSFFSYELPSRLPERVQQQLKDITKAVMDNIGFNNSPFNVEYFYDRGSDQIWLLEINTRISQSHSELYEMVDGKPNFEVMLSVGLGQKPRFPKDRGDYAYAGKYFLRVFENAYVEATPDEDVLQRVRDEMPGTRINILPEPGTTLDTLLDQDSYSYELAHIYVGARSHEELHARYQRCTDLLKPAFKLDTERVNQ